MKFERQDAWLFTKTFVGLYQWNKGLSGFYIEMWVRKFSSLLVGKQRVEIEAQDTS
jgi:hypothetical protein